MDQSVDSAISSYPQLSDTHQIVLNVLPIFSAVVSIMGSTAIIYLARERVRKANQFTSYTRLLLAMSICDILFSLTIAIATFLRPRETSFRIWAFGNDVSCSVVGFMNQLSTAGGIWYSGMLSFYFLCTARYGMTNARIARRIEPLMHLFAIGYAIATSIAGALLGLYGEKAGVMACWTSRYNNESVYDLVGLLFFAVPVMVVFICLLINNLIIYCFVRRHARNSEVGEASIPPFKPQGEILGFISDRYHADSMASSNRVPSSSSSVDDPLEHSKRQQIKRRRRLISQSQRLQLVFSQSILFVLSFLVCHFWNFIMGVLQGSAKDQAEDVELLVKHYHWAVLQATFLPMQGFFNMIIYVRPKYWILRLEFPREGRLWTVRRILRGQKLSPTLPNGDGMDGVNTTLNRPHEPDKDAVIGDIKGLKLNGATPNDVS